MIQAGLRIILVDFETTGHHATYLSKIKTWLEEVSIPVRVGNVTKAEVDEVYFRFGKWGCREAFWIFLAGRLMADEGEVIFFLYWDDVKPFWLSASSRAFLFPFPVVGLWMNTWDFRTPGRVHVKGRSLRRYPFLRESNLRLLILDEGVLAPLQQKSRSSVRWLPDFADVSLKSSATMEEVRTFRGGGKLCLMIGAILGNKDPDLFLEVARASLKTSWKFAVVGEVLVDGFVEKASALSNVHIWPGRIASESEYNAILQTADLLWGIYHRWEGSSNLITKAGLTGIPVVVASGFLAEERVRRYNLGFVVPQPTPNAVVEILLGAEKVGAGSPSVLFAESFSEGVAKASVVALFDARLPPPTSSPWGGFRLLSYRILQQGILLAKRLLRGAFS